MSNNVKAAVTVLAGGVDRSYALLTPRQLLDGRARQLARALSRPLSRAEQAWITRIEHVRAQIYASRLVLSDRTKEPRELGKIARRASQSQASAERLFKLVRMVRPTIGVELGACTGISAAYQAAAMSMNGDGHLISLEGYASLCEVARDTISKLGLEGVATIEHGEFSESLELILAHSQPDYAFIDGNHLKDATIAYFHDLAAASPGATWMVFDDIGWSRGMANAWSTIKKDPRVRTSLAIERFGICYVETEPPGCSSSG